MSHLKRISASGIVLGVALLLAVTAHAQGAADYVLAFASSGTWTLTSNLHQAREEHTATLLNSGNVLVAGGAVNGVPIVSSEIYNPATAKWTVKGNLNVDRADAGAVLLNNGQVLVAGGCTTNCLDATSTAELYNPTTGKWTLTNSLKTARAFLSLTKLANGQVLAAGGCTTLNINGCTAVTNQAEIYNPATGTWTVTSSMRTGRATHTATLLTNGAVLVAGGANAAGDALASSELFSTTTGWTLTGKMNSAHAEHTATLLGNGNVVVAGGENVSGVSQTVAEIYSPSTGKWTLTGKLNTPRQEHTAVLLANGNVLVAGGTRNTTTNSVILASAELFNPTTGVWSNTGSLNKARTGHTATLLTNGLVLAAAGSGPVNELNSAELYTP
jgi:hypothetical protein